MVADQIHSRPLILQAVVRQKTKSSPELNREEVRFPLTVGLRTSLLDDVCRLVALPCISTTVVTTRTHRLCEGFLAPEEHRVHESAMLSRSDRIESRQGAVFARTDSCSGEVLGEIAVRPQTEQAY